MQDQVNEEILLLNKNAIIPYKGTNDSCCRDLCSVSDYVIEPNSNCLIKTGIALYWDNPNYYIQILSRSGLCFKNNVNVQAGVIDRDYRKEIGVLLQNNSKNIFVVKKGDRIAQFTYLKIATVNSLVVNEFSFFDSGRNGGFGSTGK